ncbi:MAG: ABC transporter ATP-binding protein [Pelolinea sp.]|jgi:ATP-binding cassette subfamily B protein|nr:ABC transporter ATP-binding protein [Pelolinea sp.]
MISKNQYIDLKKVLSEKRFQGLWMLMSGYQGEYMGAMIYQILSALAKSGTYLLLEYFVDNFLLAQTAGFSVWVIAIGFVLLFLFQGITTFLSQRAAAETAEGTTRRLRDYLYDHIQHLTFSYHAKTDTGDLVQRCTSDVDAIRRFYADQAIGIGRIIILFLVNFIALLKLNVPLALYSVIVVPIVLFISIYFFQKVTKAYEAYQEQDAVLSTTLQENLSGVRVVKAFARQPYEIDKFKRDNFEKYKRGKKLNTLHSLFWPISDIFCGAQLLFGYYIGARMAISGVITVGTYMAYAGLVVWIIYPLRNLGRMIVQMSNGLVSYDRLYKIIKENREPLDQGSITSHVKVKGDIVFSHVSFHYEDGSEVLHDISFECKAGMAIALLGSTGSGKTTLVNLLPRFYDVSEGAIMLDDSDLRLYSRRFLREQIGIVEQEPFLFSRSIYENITFGIKEKVTQEQVEEAAKMAAIHDVILSFPQGYKTLVGERGVTLSGGQKQRVAIARTFIKDPRVLILDDSTSSVDAETEAHIQTAIHQLMQNRTTFIIAHRVQSIMKADLILVLDKGKIIQKGTHQELLQQEGVYRNIFEIQTKIEEDLQEELSRAS